LAKQTKTLKGVGGAIASPVTAYQYDCRRFAFSSLLILATPVMAAIHGEMWLVDCTGLALRLFQQRRGFL